MRSVPVAILVSTAFLLAGCSDGGGEDDHTYTCPDGKVIDLTQFPDHENATFNPASKCAKSGGTKSNSTSQAPNVLPTLVLKVSDDGGNETKVTMLDGNLTFSAEGSTDSDGTIAGIAVTVTDSNTTRTATLYDTGKKQFKSATFKFDRAGVVNVTVAMVDDRAGFTVNQTNVYVNEMIVSTAQTIQANRPPAQFSDCGGGGDLPGDVQGDLYEAQFYKEFSFPVMPGATKIEASDSENVELTICTPADESVSGDPANPAMTTADANLTAPAGTDSYYVSAYIPTATVPPGSVSAAPVIIVHYEPQSDAAPAE